MKYLIMNVFPDRAQQCTAQMVNVFIFHRDLRLQDNTSLIKQLKTYKKVLPIFVFTPEQIDEKKNNYFSHNSVQFMVETLRELASEIKSYGGKLYFFHGDIIQVLTSLHQTYPINSLAYNIDYSPYAKKRDLRKEQFCQEKKITIIQKEDYGLYNILDNSTLTKNKTPYNVFTPFRNFCYKNLSVRPIDKFQDFQFLKINLSQNKHYFDEKNLSDLYHENKHIHVHGGRTNAFAILDNIIKWKDYDENRNYLTYKTTNLSAYLHFNVVSIREVYHKIIKYLGPNNGLINELHWREFYYNIVYYYPRVMQGKPFKEKYENVKWENKHFDKWKEAKTGFPIVDACMRQLLKTGFMHNRGRMIVASFLVKLLHINWRDGERFFAQHLVDYSPMINCLSWAWVDGSGPDAQPYFRIFNPWTQSKKFDPKAEYIKYWIPELKDVPAKDLHQWDAKYEKYPEIKYYQPIIDYKKERLKSLKIYKKALQ